MANLEDFAEAVGRRIMADRPDQALEALYLSDEPLLLEGMRLFALLSEADKRSVIAMLSRTQASGQGRLSWDNERGLLRLEGLGA